MAYVLLLVGLLLLAAGAEALVRGASGLAGRLGVSSLVVGLTVVAMGTSTPELVVSLGASLSGRADLAVGNVVGSNILNVLLVLGVCSMIVPLSVSSRLVRLDVPVLLAVSAVVWWLGRDGVLGRLDGALLVLGLVAYTLVLLLLARRERSTRSSSAASPARPRALVPSILLVLAGLGLLVLGARWLVDGASAVARDLGVGELAIGLTVVAAGTSAPEIATSVVASVRGERDLAVGNVVGSNLFNLLGVLGTCAVVNRSGVPLADVALRFDVPVMVATAFLCLPVFLSGGRITRGEGLLFLLGLVAYEAVVLLHGGGSLPDSALDVAAPLFFLPCVGLGLAFGALGLVRRGRGTGARDDPGTSR